MYAPCTPPTRETASDVPARLRRAHHHRRRRRGLYVVALAALLFLSGAATAFAAQTPLYRAAAGGRYLLTANAGEYDAVINAGWYDLGPVGNLYTGPGDAAGLTPFFRLYHPFTGDHFYTGSGAERSSALGAGYVDEGIAGYVFFQPGAGRKELFRAYNPSTGQHRYTGSLTEYNALPAAWTREGVAAFLSPGWPMTLYRAKFGPYHFLTASLAEYLAVQRAGWQGLGAIGQVYASENDAGGLAPLYRMHNPFNGDHFYTINAAERDAALQYGYFNEWIAGYVFAGNAAGTKPLYRAYDQFFTRQHLFTISDVEYNNLPAGWVQEGIAGYIL